MDKKKLLEIILEHWGCFSLSLHLHIQSTDQLKQNSNVVQTTINALQERCMEAIQKGREVSNFDGALGVIRFWIRLPLSFSTLRHMDLTINRDHGIVDGFKASKDWISKFLRGCGLRSRKVTSFVTTRNLREHQQVEDAAPAFEEDVKAEMANHPHSIFCYIDQCGINRKVVSQRTLAPVGVKLLHRVMQSTSSLTHSFTVVPVLYTDGRLGEKLFVILPETGGCFPQSGHWSAPNLFVVTGTSHIMRKDQVPTFVNECMMAGYVPPLTIVLLDSWSGFKDHANILSRVPAGKQLNLMAIPPGATGLCQPLDVYFFRLFKRFIRRTHEVVIHTRPEFNCFSRDNILKVLSQTYRQLCAPVFQECFKYAWFAAGYIDKHPGPFSTPTDYAFNEVPVEGLCQRADNCTFDAFVHCCWCNKHFCFNCFIVLYHTY